MDDFAKISIFLPYFLSSDEIWQKIADMDKKEKIVIYELSLDINHIKIYAGICESLKQGIEDEMCIYIISNKLMNVETVKQYYLDIMDYQQANDELLKNEEYEIRFKEVEEKWLNGNFNDWYLR